jgi:hypothetical protein
MILVAMEYELTTASMYSQWRSYTVALGSQNPLQFQKKYSDLSEKKSYDPTEKITGTLASDSPRI